MNSKKTAAISRGTFSKALATAVIVGATLLTAIPAQADGQVEKVVVAGGATPEIVCSTNVVAECTGGLTPVTFTATASDASGPVAVICTPPSGTGFRIGTSNVVCTASNSTGVSSCNFTVTVVDTLPPTVTCHSNITTSATSPAGAVANYIASASDPCGIASFNCSPPPGSTFPIGTTTVVCSAIDVTGNTNSCSFLVTV